MKTINPFIANDGCDLLDHETGAFICTTRDPNRCGTSAQAQAMARDIAKAVRFHPRLVDLTARLLMQMRTTEGVNTELENEAEILLHTVAQEVTAATARNRSSVVEFEICKPSTPADELQTETMYLSVVDERSESGSMDMRVHSEHTHPHLHAKILVPYSSRKDGGAPQMHVLDMRDKPSIVLQPDLEHFVLTAGDDYQWQQDGSDQKRLRLERVRRDQATH